MSRQGDDPEIELGLLKLAFSKTLWRYIALLVKVVFVIPGTLVDCLIHTGRGIGGHRIIPFLVMSGLLYWGSTLFQNLAGDGLYLLWAVFTAKWIAEWLWALSRRSTGRSEHRYDPGVLVFEALGVRNSYLALLIVVVLGALAMQTEQGRLVGPLLVFGSVSAGLMYLVADAQGATQRAVVVDQIIESELESRQMDHGGGRSFSRARIE